MRIFLIAVLLVFTATSANAKFQRTPPKCEQYQTAATCNPVQYCKWSAKVKVGKQKLGKCQLNAKTWACHLRPHSKTCHG